MSIYCTGFLLPTYTFFVKKIFKNDTTAWKTAMKKQFLLKTSCFLLKDNKNTALKKDKL